MFKMLKERDLEKNNRFLHLLGQYKILSEELRKLNELKQQRKEVKEEICEIMGDFETLQIGNCYLEKKTKKIAAHVVNEFEYENLVIKDA